MSSVWTDLKESANKAINASDWDSALSDWESALSLAEKFPEGDGRQVATLEGLARTRFARGEYGEAEFLYKRALVIREAAQGSEHKDVASLVNNLGVVAFTRGMYKDAMSYFEKALAMRRKLSGPDNLDVGRTLYFLALTCHGLKKYDEADGHYRKSLDIKNKTLGNSHPELINLLRNYADLLRKTSRDGIASQMEQFASGIEAKQKKS